MRWRGVCHWHTDHTSVRQKNMERAKSWQPSFSECEVQHRIDSGLKGATKHALGHYQIKRWNASYLLLCFSKQCRGIEHKRNTNPPQWTLTSPGQWRQSLGRLVNQVETANFGCRTCSHFAVHVKVVPARRVWLHMCQSQVSVLPCQWNVAAVTSLQMSPALHS